ncbi:MAG: hypothetical protein NDF54_08775 [archaeon GB-1867-035]|nr:hypothetical protein [Candidatus Culexmicrobium profundum]
MAATPYVDISQLLNQILPLISAFLSMFMTIWLFKTFVSMFKEMGEVA